MVKILHAEAASVAPCIKALRAGKAIIYPTETVYGLGVDALNEEAVNRLYEIKARDPQKPISIAITELDAAKNFAEITAAAKKLSQKFLPGPLTIVLKLKVRMPWLTSNGKIGIRVPANDFALNLLKNFGKPITATSANISGMVSASSPSQVDMRLVQQVAIFVDDSKTQYGQASTVVDASGSKLKVLREGAVSREAIENVLNTKIE
jgi:L-threonylcarbamoyladenylate synthase